MSSDDRSSQLLELEALTSTLRDNRVTPISDWNDPKTRIEAYIQIDLDSVSQTPIVLKALCHLATDEFRSTIKFLPPIKFRVQLPEDYPSVSPPVFRIYHDWLTPAQVESVNEAVRTVIKENQGMMVLSLCYEAVINAVENMKIETIDLNSIHEKPSMMVSDFLLQKVLRQLEQAYTDVFNESNHECPICFDLIRGTHCYKFEQCEHVFCKQCVTEYFINTATGVLQSSITCPGVGCTTEAPQNMIKESIGEALYKKYDEELVRIAILKPGNTVECARESCKMPAYVSNSSFSKNLVECSYCGYNFCKLCRQTYHGVSGCKIKKEDMEEVLKKYREGTEEERVEICERFGGKKRVEDLIERLLYRNWVSKNARTCPNCNVNIEKSDGCNKMQCPICGKYFCYLCNAAITGYKHFNSGGSCHGKLFEGIQHEDDEE